MQCTVNVIYGINYNMPVPPVYETTEASPSALMVSSIDRESVVVVDGVVVVLALQTVVKEKTKAINVFASHLRLYLFLTHLDPLFNDMIFVISMKIANLSNERDMTYY